MTVKVTFADGHSIIDSLYDNEEQVKNFFEKYYSDGSATYEIIG